MEKEKETKFLLRKGLAIEGFEKERRVLGRAERRRFE